MVGISTNRWWRRETQVPQTLTINGATLSISGGNSVTLPNAVDLDPYVRLDQSTIPTVDNTFDIGSSTRRYNDVYAETSARYCGFI